MKIKVLLFARSFLAKYYSEIHSEIIEPLYVTLTKEEKKYLQDKGLDVHGCFEEEYDQLFVADIPGDYLKTSFASDRFLNRFSYEKRCEILGKEISFWRNLFDTLSPDYLFNETVAIEIAEVMAIEAEKRSIPFYSALLGFVPNTFYWKPDPFTGRLQDLSVIEPTKEAFALADEYIENVTKKSLVPFYVKSYVGKSRKSFLRFVKSTLFGSVHYIREQLKQHQKEFCYEEHSQYSFVYTKYYVRSFFKRYDKMSDISGRSFVYLPLHMEPEATLSYFVNENYRQDFLIDSVVKSLQIGQYLVVKEHPQQPGLLLEPRFQLLKKQYSNLVFLPSNVPSYEILKSCQCIVTLTSSAAWEGLLLKKPTLVLGKIFFDQCPGAIRICGINELKSVLRKGGYTVAKDEDIRMFVARMISIFHPGCPTPSAKDSGINDYVKAIESLIHKEV